MSDKGTGLLTEGPVEDTSAPKRWHQLDALRGFAMLLGIALHASLSFFPWVWAVQDATATSEGPFDEFFHAVHGFRMPLFFLISGFFTAMLWRRRGLSALLKHRVKRIALPLAIGMVTIVPAVGWSVSWAVDNGVSDYIEEHSDIWAAVYFGNADAVKSLLEDDVDVNAPNPDSGDTPLHVAAYVGHVEIAELLLESGADPNAASDDGTPLSYAVYVGNADMADLLIAEGAADLRPAGTDWDDISYWASGAEEVPSTDEVLGLDSWLDNFYHLWFLWFLLWLVAGFGVVAWVVDRLGSGRPEPSRWSGAVMWALIPLAVVPQLAMGEGGANPVFGPDTSTGLIPTPHVLGYYAVFFSFGALLFGRPNRAGGLLVESIGRWWVALLPLGALTFIIALHLTFDSEDAAWLPASIAQVAYAWIVVFGLMGLFQTVLGTERRGVRYLSDSSYWLYLTHLPLIIIGSSVIRNWDLPAGAKFLGLFLGVTGLLLVTYQLFVRYTPIGTLLNGKRTRPSRIEGPSGTETVSGLDAAPASGVVGSASAMTDNPTKGETDVRALEVTDLARSFGDVRAVDGVDLSIREGELFALLGPNGSGKTTTISMLCCLLRPDRGSASVMGHDVQASPLAVKAVISVVPQETAIAEHLNAWENMRLMGGLHGVPPDQVRSRSEQLLEVLGLTARADERAKKYSGGMKRRLSIAMALVSDPQVLFLDEPTLGLDPQARRGMWEHIASLKGTKTILLTTHYLEEADALADRIAIIDAGRIIAEGTAAELKASIDGGHVTEVRAPGIDAAATAALQEVYPQVRPVEGGVEIVGDDVDLYRVQDLLRPLGVTIESIGRKQTSLDDVFLTLTGKQWRE